jgi:hypothetical protein
VHLVFDIFQGIGAAAAVGIRPFLPGLVVGALGAAGAQIDFKGSDFAFLQRPVFLGVMLAGVIVLALVERRRPEGREIAPALAVAGAAVGALLFAGSLCRGGYAIWPGIVGGIICALIGAAASRPLLARVRARLDEASGAVLPLFAEATAVLFAALSILLPPVGPIGLALLLWLLYRGRGREGRKFAGLRILR